MSSERVRSRVLIYSHDSFGLGHLRRCRAIANALVERNPDMTVLILSGSPIIGNFEFRPRVDFVRIPGVIKRSDGDYTSQSLDLDVEDTLALRASIIRHTAEAFDPDLFLVDKEPLGLRGEVGETLSFLKARGTPLVLGLRDVLDEPRLLGPEWRRKNVLPALRDLYDEIWVYGLPQVCNPLADIDLPSSVHHKIVYTGYLRRSVAEDAPAGETGTPFADPWLLVTPGGGGDGERLIDWVIGAYEHDGDAPYPSLIVFGPFMPQDKRMEFTKRISQLPKVKAITFDPDIEILMHQASGIVAMGGYNTFCEILSFDKPALIVPRTKPRLEQYIRATRAEELGLLKCLTDDGRCDPRVMATALRHLPQQAKPSEKVVPGLLDGLPNVDRLTGRLLQSDAGPRIATSQQQRV